MQAITQYLLRRLLLNDLPSTLLPAIGRSDFGTERTDEKQGDCLPEQMGIGREIRRKVVVNVSSAHTESPQPFVTKTGYHGWRICEQKICPDPRQTSERHFQAAGPINADWIRVFSVPVLPLVEYFLGKPLITCKPVCLRQNHEMLMAVQFPDNFAIAGFFKIKIADVEPELSGRPFNVNPVEMPINQHAIIKAFITKQIKAMAGDLLRPPNNLCRLLRQPLLKQ